MEQIKIKLDGGMMPKRATPFDAAYDIYVPKDTDICSTRTIVDTGFAMELPHGFAAFIRSRSGYSAKGIEVIGIGFDGSVGKIRINAEVLTGLIDAGFRGTLGVIVRLNDSSIISAYKRLYFPKGERIAQLQIVRVPDTELVEADELDMTDDRGGGFGHTNK